MEFARTLKTLWRRRRLLLVGVALAAIAALLSVYQVSLFPPSLTQPHQCLRDGLDRRSWSTPRTPPSPTSTTT